MHGLCRLDRRDHHFFAGLFVKRGAGAFLDHLLVLALHGAFALTQADNIVVFVAEQLHLDVLDGVDEFLYVARAVAEGCLSLAARGEERLLELLDDVHAANAPAAAAGARLDQKRKADALRFRHRGVQVLHHIAARCDGNARRAHGFARHVLVAEHGDHVGGGTDEVDVALLAERDEFGVLAEQTVARVDRLRAALDRDGEDGGDIEVAVRDAVAADAVAFVGELDVHGVLVRLGIDGDGGNAHLAAGADDPYGDLAAVCNQDFRKHINSPPNGKVIIFRSVQVRTTAPR